MIIKRWAAWLWGLCGGCGVLVRVCDLASEPRPRLEPGQWWGDPSRDQWHSHIRVISGHCEVFIASWQWSPSPDILDTRRQQGPGDWDQELSETENWGCFLARMRSGPAPHWSWHGGCDGQWDCTDSDYTELKCRAGYTGPVISSPDLSYHQPVRPACVRPVMMAMGGRELLILILAVNIGHPQKPFQTTPEHKIDGEVWVLLFFKIILFILFIFSGFC